MKKKTHLGPKRRVSHRLGPISSPLGPILLPIHSLQPTKHYLVTKLKKRKKKRYLEVMVGRRSLTNWISAKSCDLLRVGSNYFIKIFLSPNHMMLLIFNSPCCCLLLCSSHHHPHHQSGRYNDERPWQDEEQKRRPKRRDQCLLGHCEWRPRGPRRFSGP